MQMRKKHGSLPGMTAAPLSDRIVQQFDNLTPQLREAARFVLEHPQDVALLSMRELARRAGVPPVTMLRLARQLDFPDYAAFRQVHATALRKAQARPQDRPLGSDFALRAEGLQKRGERLPERMEQMLSGQVSRLTARNTAAFTAAAESIERARRVYVLGLRSCFGVAFQFAYVYGLLRDNGVLLDGGGGTGTDALRQAGPQDVLLTISLNPYTRAAVEQTDFALQRGVSLLAITDSELSPLARRAKVSLLVPAESPSFFHSLTPAFAAAEMLLGLLAARGGTKMADAIRNAESQLAAFDTYWAERPKAKLKKTANTKRGKSSP